MEITIDIHITRYTVSVEVEPLKVPPPREREYEFPLS